MHAAAAALEPDDAQAFAAFLYSLARVLPCPECREHLRVYLNALPPEQVVSDAITASRYCFDLHNYVNRSIDKAPQDPQLLLKLYDVQLSGLKAANQPRQPRPRRQLAPWQHGPLPLARRSYRMPR